MQPIRKHSNTLRLGQASADVGSNIKHGAVKGDHDPAPHPGSSKTFPSFAQHEPALPPINAHHAMPMRTCLIMDWPLLPGTARGTRHRANDLVRTGVRMPRAPCRRPWRRLKSCCSPTDRAHRHRLRPGRSDSSGSLSPGDWGRAKPQTARVLANVRYLVVTEQTTQIRMQVVDDSHPSGGQVPRTFGSSPLRKTN